MVRASVVALVACAACQGSGKSATPADASAGGSGGSGVAGFGNQRSGSGSSGVVAIPGSDDDGGSADAGSGSGSGSADEPDVVVSDPGKAGAVSAWQVVVDRTKYLERRKQHGVAYGTLGGDVMVPAPPVEGAPDAGVASHVDAALVASPYVWLVDDTEGNGALAMRVQMPANVRTKPAQGDRVALGGAWALDEDRRWFWRVDAITPLAPLPAAISTKPAPPSSAPGHVIATGDMPAGAHTISIAKEGELAYFQLVGAPPRDDGDGWPVADELGNPPYALLALPGERATYGAQDLRTPDERWALRRGVTYVVRLGHIHKHDGKPATINARTAPVKVM